LLQKSVSLSHEPETVNRAKDPNPRFGRKLSLGAERGERRCTPQLKNNYFAEM